MHTSLSPSHLFYCHPGEGIGTEPVSLMVKQSFENRSPRHSNHNAMLILSLLIK